jgi:hypothetical protein
MPAKLSFSITYTKTGSPRHIHPTSPDPLSPFNWGGAMWMATNSGTFSLTYADGSFSAQGSFDSAGNFGEMGTERNGLFVLDELAKAGAALPLSAQPNPALSTVAPTASPAQANATQASNSPKFKGRVPGPWNRWYTSRPSKRVGRAEELFTYLAKVAGLPAGDRQPIKNSSTRKVGSMQSLFCLPKNPAAHYL